ncbi:MAG: hypothetical protein ACRDQZ_05345, partial [Mycobacteriales bacterium]
VSHPVIAYPLTVQHVSHPITPPPPNRDPAFTVAIKEHPPDRRCTGCGSTRTAAHVRFPG